MAYLLLSQFSKRGIFTMAAPKSEFTGKVVSLSLMREIREVETQNPEYHARILGMSKLELLEEMVRFQEERTNEGRLTLDMMVRGKLLFKALEDSAETQELKLLTGSYRRHLDLELKEYLEARRQGKIRSIAREEYAEIDE
jgi:hypothetical protein